MRCLSLHICGRVFAANPALAAGWVDEILELLLYLERVHPNELVDSVFQKNTGVAAETQWETGRIEGDGRLYEPSFARIVAMRFVSSLSGHHPWLDEIVLRLVMENNDANTSSQPMLPGSDLFGRRYRILQSLCLCIKHVSRSTTLDAVMETLLASITANTPVAMRHYVEKSLGYLATEHPDVVMPHLDHALKTFAQPRDATVSSWLIVLAVLVAAGAPEPTMRSYARYAIPWLGAPRGQTRTLSQWIVFTSLSALKDVDADDTLSGVMSFLSQNKKVSTMRKRQTACFGNAIALDIHEAVTFKSIITEALVDPFGEVIAEGFYERISKVMVEVFDEIIADENAAMGTSKNAAPQEGERQPSKFDWQRKIDPGKVEKDSLLARVCGIDNTSGFGRKQRKRSNLVVVASLIDKIPNLAGLARTCEIFSAQKLAMRDLKITRQDDFKRMSVTANLWQPFQEEARF